MLGGNRNSMTEFFNDLNKKSDEELIAIADGKIPYFLSAKSTTTSQDVIMEAKAILHRRQRKEKSWHEKSWGKILIGVIIGLIVFMITFYASRYLQKDQSQDLPKGHEKTENTKAHKSNP